MNLNGAEILPDRTIKKRFNLVCHNEQRRFSFEAVLDVDYADWFYSIQKNTEVSCVWLRLWKEP